MSSSTQPPVASLPNKNVLVILYSQTGQLSAIAERTLAPLLADASISVHLEILKPVREHPFPWPFFRFLDTFPESAHLVPEQLHPLGVDEATQFDLVLIFYQVWFLAPSRPVVAFLDMPIAKRMLRGKPVVTIIACRNMWMQAHTQMCRLLSQIGARHLDNVVLTDRAPTLATLLTTPLWLLTGRKTPVPGLPTAGVTPAEIKRSIRFGRALRDALHAGREQGAAPLLSGLAAVEAQPQLMVSERAGSRSFYLWGKLLRLAGPPGAWPRKPLLVFYIIFLLGMIVTVVPLSLAVQSLLRPLFKQRLTALKTEFEHPSGSGTERLKQYDY